MGRQSGLSIRSYATAVSTSTAADVADQSGQENAMQLEIEESERATIQTTLTSRPANTQRKYVGYQNEFVKWCTASKFRDCDTVTGGKLHLFLTSEVIGRKSKKNSDKVGGGSTVCGYVNAIVDLNSQQVTLRTNSNPHPRTPADKQLIKNIQDKTTETRKKKYEDRGIGSLLDRYSSTEQFRQICDAFFALNNLRGRTSCYRSTPPSSLPPPVMSTSISSTAYVTHDRGNLASSPQDGSARLQRLTRSVNTDDLSRCELQRWRTL